MSDKLSNLIDQSKATQSSWIRFNENRNRKWGLVGQDWGIHELNLPVGGTGGIIGRKVTTIAALPGIGKTAMINPIVEGSTRWKEVSAPSKPEILIFSWEMDPSELVDRFVASKTGFTSKDLMVGAKLLDEASVNEIKKALEEIRSIPIFYHPTSIGIKDLLKIYYEFTEYCDDLRKEDGISRQPICIIDYAGLASFQDSGVRTYGINEFYYEIKQAVNKTNGHFIILAQLDKSARGKDYPVLDNLADSQFIERNSDNILLLHRPEYDDNPILINPANKSNPLDSKNKMLIRGVKCRLFGRFELVVGCDISRSKFWSLKQDRNYEYWKHYNDPDFWKQILKQ